MAKSYGDDFQQQSKYHRNSLPRVSLDWNKQPPPFKTYPKAKQLPLPPPTHPHTSTLFNLLQSRKSIRVYLDKPLPLKDLSQLLWASTGLQRTEQSFSYRTAPSAGALYPIETYLVINRINHVPQGIYHYNVKYHLLEELNTGDFRQAIAHAALDQPMCASAAVVFIWTGVFFRSKWKYGQRAYRYIYLDAGHIAENLALTATALQLGSCQIAALYDDEINALIDVDGVTESVLYLSSVGYLKR
jgi:SagB-type dehydrogenase family enzyme